ncbi:MAG: wax ester/triacylglycerol synthase family O-acyltransferase [Acidimicrobiia bacterium]|nr:wax ester/triacylglycerol synthase family O-acyltransferase [Acidimicrobiia bacterium]MBT8217811.1 wax ester/triacylglycerol synthase family O-acyltransferase [Acidimicrobiia bacterium]NNF08803.1 wax ester/triacylglycerol synthase family O-acyltransferase [Acidimicrobiia bacterium]
MTTHYERLSFLDSTFLAMEDRNAHFHVAGVMKFAPGGLRAADGSVDLARVKGFIESKLHNIPRYRQVLDWVPLEEHPVWVDDEFFDIDYHVRRATLTEERNDDELQRLAGTIFSQKLDRFRPLWEVWVVDGFEDDSVAMITKVHHCMIDGMAGVDLMKELLAPFPITEFPPPMAWEPRRSPSKLELLTDEAQRRMAMPFRALRDIRNLGDSVSGVITEVDTRVRAMRKALSAGWLKNASATPLNARIGPNRDFRWAKVDLGAAKSVKNALGGTINDVVLATVAGAVRKYLLAHNVAVDHVDFRAMAPVSVRSEGDMSLGNQVAMWLLDLPISLQTPRERYQRIAEETIELKETDQALGASLLVQATSWTPSTILTSAMRLAGTNVRPFNMTVTNVPGPQIPIYFLDALLEVQYPMVPLWTNHGVGIALFSYNGKIAWGVVSDSDSVTDIDRFMDYLDEAFRELVHLATPKPVKKAAASSGEKTAAKRTRSAKTAAAKKTTTAKKSSAKSTTKKTSTTPAPAKKPATKKTATTKKPAAKNKVAAKKQAAAGKSAAKKPAAKKQAG